MSASTNLLYVQMGNRTDPGRLAIPTWMGAMSISDGYSHHDTWAVGLVLACRSSLKAQLDC